MSKETNAINGHESPTTQRVESIKDRHGILVLVTEPRGSLEQIGLTEYSQWFADALKVNKNRIKALNVIDEPLPNTIPHSGVIIGGSTHSVYENLPWIQRLKEFIRAMAEQNKPMLGVCFGHQAIVEALGGKVEKGRKGREFGTTEIDLTEDGKKDPLFLDLPSPIRLATSHADVVTRLPDRQDLKTLANNRLYPYQALAIRDNIRTIQPHPEITCNILEALAISRKDVLIKEGFLQDDSVFESFSKAMQSPKIEANGRKILQNFNNRIVGPYHLGIKA